MLKFVQSSANGGPNHFRTFWALAFWEIYKVRCSILAVTKSTLNILGSGCSKFGFLGFVPINVPTIIYAKRCTCELDTVRHHSTKVFVFSRGYLPPVLHGAKKSREKGEKWSYGRGFQGSRSTNLES